MRILFFFSLLLMGYSSAAQTAGTLEIVAELQIRPGNVTVSAEERIFCTVHPLENPVIQLIEIGKNGYKPFPNADFQKTDGVASMEKFDTPLGVLIDEDNWLWVIDMGLNLGTTRLFAFDLKTNKEVYRLDFPADVAPKGSFIQDLAVDKKNGWAYLADINNPGILAVDLDKRTVRRFFHKNMNAKDIDMVIDDKVINFNGAPARVAVNPISLSVDGELLYFGAMNGIKWYKLSTKLFREKQDDYYIQVSILKVGKKPVSDGCTTDAEGSHYFTNLNNSSIDILTKGKEYKTLVQDPLLNFPDNCRFGPDGWLYIAANQLHLTPAFTGSEDMGKPPYRILRVKTDSQGMVGR